MPRTVVEVRTASREDVDLLLGLSHRLDPEEVPASRHERTAQRHRLAAAVDRSDVSILLACASQEPVGLLVLRHGELIPLGGTSAVHVEQLYVDAAWRRRGVARQLLSAAVHVAEHSGAADVVCTAPPGVRQAQRFLARLGFAPLAVQRVVAVTTLRRRLAGDLELVRRTSAVQAVLARRRREARTRPVVAADADPVDVAG